MPGIKYGTRFLVLLMRVGEWNMIILVTHSWNSSYYDVKEV